MRLSIKPVQPCTSTSQAPFQCCTNIMECSPIKAPKTWERLFLRSAEKSSSTMRSYFTPTMSEKISKRWMDYQGARNWEGLLDPLDDNLRGEIIRYGHFVESAYQAFDFEPSSPSYASCRYPKSTLLDRSGSPETGYRVTKHLRATPAIQLPRWMEKAPSWMATRASWIGYVAVCNDKEEIARLGRRDVVIAFRGTATVLEWLENLRATLTDIPGSCPGSSSKIENPMVESGFMRLYTSKTEASPSLQDLVREEISRILRMYGDECLSFTITGHSLGAALATLAAYDIKTTFKRAPLVTVISFGGPRVGNRSFQRHVEKQGTKILRIVNSDDLITKLPGFVIDNNDLPNNGAVRMKTLPSWIQRHVEETQWAYAEVGREFRLSSRDSPYLNGVNIATCHDLKTYLHLVNGFVSSTCPFRVTTRRMLKKKTMV